MLLWFIRRPVLSSVVSILIVLLGVLALTQLPLAQFPSIAPPEVNVTVEYTGANAETVTKAAIVPLERSINGVPGMKYMSSDAGNDGVGVVQILFEVGTDPDVAAVNVQNRVASVMGELPEEILRNGVKIAKEENAMLMYLNIFSSDPGLDEKFLYNFADINVLAELKRIKGVGFADILGAKEYAMRVWLKPDKMLAYGIAAEDVIDVLNAQSIEAAPGKIGETSDRISRELQYVVRYPGKYNTEEQYEQIAVRATEEGEILRLKDIADVELSTTYYDVEAKRDGRPAAAIMLKQLPGSNASDVVEEVKRRMAAIKSTSFLAGMDYEVTYDVSSFLDASMREVIRTLIEAFLLVSIVTYLFLQDWRATLIPIIAVPVSLIGTLLFVYLLGFSLNLITLFALVLAIGIVVDGAIVVVEAVHAKLESGCVGPRRATEDAMREMGGAIIAITLVMSAVFVPVAFMSGPSGIFFRQFSLTMAVAILLSGVVALTLTPALCARLLRAPERKIESAGPVTRFFARFNRAYEQMSESYSSVVRAVAGRRVVTWSLLAVFCVGSYALAARLPSGFIPNEDQGMFYVSVTTPPGATLERTKAVVGEIQRSCASIPAVKSISTLAGTNVLSDGTGATYGTCLIDLKDWDEREESVQEVMDEVTSRIAHVKDAAIELFPPPAVPGYGNASGFELRVLDKTGSGDFKRMESVVNQFLDDLQQRPEIESAFTIFDASYPQYLVHIDHDLAAQRGLTASSVMDTLQTLLGGEYATNFIRFGQMYKVMVQALPEYRARPEDILTSYVKNSEGKMVQLATVVRLEKVQGVDQITRYNMFPSAEVNGGAASGYSSGDVIRAIQETAREKLPNGYGIDWAGITRDEVETGHQALLILLVSLLFVYLLLAAQYESFLLPIPVILSLPAGILGAFLFLNWMGLENNIYAQIALLMLVGLLGKNAILIVEFAAQRQQAGSSALQAAVEAGKLRLRPILMTSLALVAGLVPLVLASGVGAVGNQTIGATATGGMIIGTVFGVLVTPGLYLVFASRRMGRSAESAEEAPVDAARVTGGAA
jgi:HAE1 family hydrophobic/amphiphilic exporter-1